MVGALALAGLHQRPDCGDDMFRCKSKLLLQRQERRGYSMRRGYVTSTTYAMREGWRNEQCHQGPDRMCRVGRRNRGLHTAQG